MDIACEGYALTQEQISFGGISLEQIGEETDDDSSTCRPQYLLSIIVTLRGWAGVCCTVLTYCVPERDWQARRHYDYNFIHA